MAVSHYYLHNPVITFVNNIAITKICNELNSHKLTSAYDMSFLKTKKLSDRTDLLEPHK